MNSLPDQDLWNKIAAHDLNGGAVSGFSQRLMREHGWSRDFVEKAIGEYKKFIYLICVSNQILSPSEIVDDVWHLHLLYTRDYWTIFCKQVLQKDIHHDPSSGGGGEKARYADCYRATKIAYEHAFGYPPAPDMWPGKQALSTGADKRLDTSKYLKIATAILSLAILPGCSIQGTQFKAILIIMPMFAAIVYLVQRNKKRNDRSNCGGSGGGSCGADTGGDGGGGCGGGCGGGD